MSLEMSDPSFVRPLAVTLLACAACASDVGEEDPVLVSTSALVDSDPVSAAVNESCTTTSVAGLSTQLVEEIQCMRPGTLAKIEDAPGLVLGPAVFPWLQAPALSGLLAAQRARGVPLRINSGLRTLAQQYLLYRWYRTGRCGIGLAASPGTSNHESALAVDIADNAAWRSAMEANGFRWLGANDPVHFDYVGEGRVELRGLSVLAFQRLWNRNHPEDLIAEDSDYGPETEARLSRSPVGGFPKGADCTAPRPPEPPPPADVPIVADAPEPGAPTEDGSDGCSASPRPPASSGGLGLLLVAGAMLARRRRFH